MGPFTNVVGAVRQRKAPIDYNDKVSMYHDIDYIGASNPYDVYVADSKALINYDYSPVGLLGKIGMLIKMTTPVSSLFLISGDKKLESEIKQLADQM
jgi:hypothetical protein